MKDNQMGHILNVLKTASQTQFQNKSSFIIFLKLVIFIKLQVTSQTVSHSFQVVPYSTSGITTLVNLKCKEVLH